MQFELSGMPDAATLATALRAVDPQAKVALDAESGRLDVVSSASNDAILAALRKAGVAAEPAVHEIHVSGGSTCCGGCG